jgi:hypothetical protein
LIKVHTVPPQRWRKLKISEEAAGNQFLSVALKVLQVTPQVQAKISRLVKFQADPLCGILQTPSKSLFKILILETPLWQCAMSASLKSPPEGLKNAECKKGTPPIRLPIPFVPPTNLQKKKRNRANQGRTPGWDKVPDANLWLWE